MTITVANPTTTQEQRPATPAPHVSVDRATAAIAFGIEQLRAHVRHTDDAIVALEISNHTALLGAQLRDAGSEALNTCIDLMKARGNGD